MKLEFQSLANDTIELIWIRILLRDLHIILPSPLVIHCDNIGATYMSTNPIMYGWTKHVEIDYHFNHE